MTGVFAALFAMADVSVLQYEINPWSMGAILSFASPSVLMTPPRDRSCSLRCSSVNDVLIHFVLDLRPLAGERRFDISATGWWAMENWQLFFTP